MNTAQQLLPGVNFLILRRDLEGKGLGVPERWAAVETETGNAQDSEPPSAHRPSCRLDVAGSLVNGGYFTIRKSNGVEARRHARPCRTRGRSCSLASVRVLLVLNPGERRGLWVGPLSVTHQFIC
jgi:hypothetical protein